MGLRIPADSRRRAVSNMLMLYLSKASGVVVGLLFIPLYSRVLGPSQFGVVAVILSLQALLVMLDFGMSAQVGRDAATGTRDSPVSQRLHRGAEVGLGSIYLGALLTIALLMIVGVAPDALPVTATLCSVMLFLFLVLQNLYYCTMLARGEYASASRIQLVGNISRAGTTAIVLTYFSATLTAFIVTQTICAALHAWGTRIYVQRSLPRQTIPISPRQRLDEAWDALRRGRSLALIAAAGAAVMQLDKPIISIFMSNADTARYFLAMTVCLVPTSILAGPVAQYFQPQLLKAGADGDIVRLRRVGRLFALALLLAILPLTAALWFGRAPLIELWLGARPDNAIISTFVGLLLPGIGIGALGYLPYSLLLFAQDFRFQALLSIGLTVVTLTAATIAARAQSLETVCIVYSVYHGMSTFVIWLRAIWLNATKSVALQTGALVASTILVVLLLVMLFRA